MIPIHAMAPAPPIIDQLLSHRTLGGVPRPELDWLVAHGHPLEIPAGGLLTAKDGVVLGMYIVLTGRLSIHVDRGAGPRRVMEWHAGDVTGLLPYSRLKAPPADVMAEEPASLLLIERQHFDRLTRECPQVTAVLVHVMLDRARAFTSSDLLDERMLSLGRLAAGLAHELNNPASAVARNAATLGAAVDELEAASRLFCGLGLTDAQCVAVRQARSDAAATPRTATRSPIEVSDWEDSIADWLDEHDVAGIEADKLVQAGLTVDLLDRLASAVEARHLGPVSGYLAAELTVRQLTTDIETAASRIHGLVAAVKRFTYMDRAMVATPVDLTQGLTDTVTLLSAKARQKGVDLRVDLEPDLPLVDVYGGELNQVWTNLVDNALDATPRGGRVVVSAARVTRGVLVQVTDTGTGIPEHVQPRVFDPFFTTKDVGEGTGLGLDIARRLVARHRGTIEFSTGSEGTQFCVTLPAVPPAAQALKEREGHGAISD
jgi:signal transduction histidine kinase